MAFPVLLTQDLTVASNPLLRRGDTPGAWMVSLYTLAATAHHPVARYDHADSGFLCLLRGRTIRGFPVRFLTEPASSLPPA